MVRVQAASAFKRLGQPFDEFIKKGGRYDLSLQPLTAIHLHSQNIGSRYIAQGDIKYVYIFAAVGLFIMLLACVNFTNLATAQSAKRGKEVGIRKVLGSERKQLIAQFMAEAFLYTIAATLVACFIVAACLPAFNQLSAKVLTFTAFININTVMAMLSLVLLTTMLAGVYPAFFLTSFKPAAVLKGSGNSKSGGSFLTRNALVVFQFTVSTVLIICTIIVYKQLVYSQSKDLGFNKSNVLIVSNADRLGIHEESFRQELMRLPEVANATISTSLPTQKSYTDTYKPEAGDNMMPSGKDVWVSGYMVDESFVPTLNLKILEGRNFSKDFTDSASVILNETAVKQMGWTEPIGKFVDYPGDRLRFKVIGIVKDFNTESL
jgi:putative ABC transport system permease protein